MIKKLLTMPEPELFDKISKTSGAIIQKNMYIYIDDFPLEIKPLICVHLDTCNWHNVTDKDITEKKGIISLKPKSKLTCLGADDRAGVWVALELLKAQRSGKTKTNFAFAFFCGEESGCIGSSFFVKSPPVSFQNINCFIGVDRKSSNFKMPEIATYGYDSEELEETVKSQLPDYQWKVGSITDCSILSDATDKPCFNITAGYNNEHTPKEKLDTKLMVKVFNDLSKLKIGNNSFQVDFPVWDDSDREYGREILCDNCQAHEPLYESGGFMFCLDCLCGVIGGNGYEY